MCLLRSFIIFNETKYSSCHHHQGMPLAKSSSSSRKQKNFTTTTVSNSLFQTIFLFVLILCGNFGGIGIEIEAYGQSSSPPTTIAATYYFPPSSIYYETSERRNSRFYHALNKQQQQAERRMEKSTPKTTEIKNVEASFELPTTTDVANSTSQPMTTNKMVPHHHHSANVIHRFIRQIVPLARSTVKPKSSYGVVGGGGDFVITPDIEKMLNLYRDFLIDYAFKRGWQSAQFIVPQEVSLKVCQYFILPVLLSRASLQLNCSNDLFISDILKTDLKQAIILADFTVLKTNKDSDHKRLPIDLRLLNQYSRKRKILLLARNESVEKIVNSTRPQNLVNYKWTLVAQAQNNTNLGLLEIYKVFGFSTSLAPLFQMVGNWSSANGLQVDPSKDIGIPSFQGHMLRVTTVAGPPVVNLHPPLLASVGSMPLVATGYLPDLLELISVVLNFKYSILTPSDGKFGDKDSTGNWSGMVGMLQKNEADLALMSFSYTQSRLRAMDFSPAVEYSATRLLIRRDWQPAELKLDAFIRPFEWKVWITIILLIGLGTITLIIFTSFRLFKATPGESMWLLSTCFLLQGQSEHSTIQVTPFRIASGTFWMLAVFIFACYTARLTSFLAADTEKLPVKDLAEAVKSRSWKIGLTRGSSFLEKVKESKSKEMTLLWKRLQDDSSVLVNGFTDGIAKVYKERYIFFTGELIPSFMVKGNCSYTWLPGKYFPGFGSMGYQKGLPYASSISRMVSKLRETGLMRRTFKKWWGTDSSCGARTGSDAFTAISLHETGSAFLVLAIGAGFAVACGVFEFVLSVKRENRKDKMETQHAMSSNEFAAPVVQGTVNLLPVLMHYDRPFIWRVQDSVIAHQTLDYPSLGFSRKRTFYNSME